MNQVNCIKLFFSRRFAAFLVSSALPAIVLAGNGPSGVGNFQKVDDRVYRGAQPTGQGFKELAKLGIQIVVDLREGGSQATAEEKIVKAAGMRYVSVPMKGMATPSNESVAKVLALLEDTTTGPVFVHCRRGADRTGGVIACYRIEHDHWQNDRALTEARSMGMSWFQLAIQHYVQNYQPNGVNAAAPSSLEARAPVSATAFAAAVPQSVK
jgi:tyrosine-protein phosphatase SIW14